MAELFNKWKAGLARSSKAAFGQIATLFGATEITSDTWDDLEALLIQADLGVETTDLVIAELENRVSREGLTRAGELKEALRQELRLLLPNPPALVFDPCPNVILIVGVNGSGKTTSIAKLGQRYTQQA